MVIYTGVADANGDFNIPFSANYTSGQKITVTAEKDSATKSIELYAPSEVGGGGVIQFTGDYNNFPENIGDMHFSSDITAIAPYAFYQAGAGGVTFRTSVTGLKFDAITTIGEYAFYAFNACKSIDFGNQLKSIGNYSFQNCSQLQSVNFGNSLQTIGIDSFFGCSKLQSINLPDTLTSLGSNAFSGCVGVKSINISAGLTSLPGSAFRNCKPTSLIIPAGMVSMGSRALSGMTTLTELTMLPTTPPTITADTLESLPSGCVIYVPVGTLAAYQAAANWSVHASKMIES